MFQFYIHPVTNCWQSDMESLERVEPALYCLEQGYELQFRLGPTLQGGNVRVYTNYPSDPDQCDVLQFRPLDWVHPHGQTDHWDKYCRLDLTVAGSYQYYFSCGGKTMGGGVIVVEPVLTVGPAGDVLPLHGIRCQSYLSGRLGTLDTWLGKLRVAKETGYNMIHMTPLQRLGGSRLCHSISQQVELDSTFSPEGRSCCWEDVRDLLELLRKDWEMVCISDVVYDHTASDSEWLSLHPECGFNLENSAELKGAWLVDRGLWRFSGLVADGYFSNQGLPPLIQEESHMTALRGLLWHQVFSPLRLWEFLQVDVEEALEQFRQFLLKGGVGLSSHVGPTEVQMLHDPEWRRFGQMVDINSAALLFSPHSMKPVHIHESCSRLRTHLDQFNWNQYTKISHYTEQVMDSLVEQVRLDRLACEGPRLGVVSRTQPLWPRYFTFPFGEMSFAEEQQLMERRETARCILAYDASPRRDRHTKSAELDPELYLGRQLECDGNNVKLRYGAMAEDCPYLWDHMKTYTQITAGVFSGVCVVNCSSTPLHVTEAMLAAARAVRPNLYVIAEQTDVVSVNRLGITSLVRGVPDTPSSGAWLSCFGKEPIGAFVQPSLRPLTPAAAHSMFKDSSPFQPGTHSDLSVYNIMADTTLLSMACCATCSTRGYDELLLHQESGMSEVLHYASWNGDGQTGNRTDPTTGNRTDLTTGIMAARLSLNRLHQQLSNEGFTQVDVKHLDGDVIVVTRHCPCSHRSVVAVVRRAGGSPETNVQPIFTHGHIWEVLFEAVTVVDSSDIDGGVNQWKIVIREHIQLQDSQVKITTRQYQSQNQEVHLENVPRGYVIIFRTALDSTTWQCVQALRRQLVQFLPQYQDQSLADQSLAYQDVATTLVQPVSSALSRLSLVELNLLLYRCHGEEQRDGRGCYHIPQGAPLIYGGLQGLVSVMAEIRPHNDLRNPFCENLRRGDWLMDYTTKRLLDQGGAVERVGGWLEAMFGYVKLLPRELVPSYFDAIIQGVYASALKVAFRKMSRFVQCGSTLVKQLALASVQMCAAGHSWTHLHLSPGLKVAPQSCVWMAAGLPHFSVAAFGCWSRTTFMSFRGILLLTGRHSEARNLLLLLASSLRYGLIPNLLSPGGAARYSSRDAVWWWLQSIQDFCSLVPQGLSILHCPVSRVYPTDQSEPQPAGAWEQPLYDVIQEVLQRHMQGISFREENAGPQLDPDMMDEGFHVEAGVDPTTGFVYGGNRFNCGTWMDKMGTSDRAHNRGVPATPRDGSAVELVGLSKSAVSWLKKLHADEHFPYGSVSVSRAGQTVQVSYEDWDQRIQEHFDKTFYISRHPVDCEDQHPHLIHKRGIYKDSWGASSPWCDYQLRPNFTVAMVVAPELFPVQKAWDCLTVAEEKLLGPLGMKTLDPDDLVYCGVYDMDLDDGNFNRAKGFNYHQGPEWVWPLGYFLRAKLYFGKKVGQESYESSLNLVKKVVSRHSTHLQRSPWKGLPELTNEGGLHCPFSCGSHAPSMASMLELLYDL